MAAWLIVLILTAQTALLICAAVKHSATCNEPAHLAAGVSYWRLHRFELYRVNPPLVRMIGAMPLIVAGVNSDWHSFHDDRGARPEFAVGRDFALANKRRFQTLLMLARLAVIPITALGGIVCARWSWELYGARSSVIAALLWAFSPNLLAYGALVTPDAAATSFGLLANYLFWRWLRCPTWQRAPAAGIGLGIALMSKTTWLLMFVLWPVLCWARLLALHRASAAGHGACDHLAPRWRRDALQCVAMLAIALYSLNCAYAFNGFASRLGEYTFSSRLLAGNAAGGNRWAASWLGGLPIPAPRDFVLGLDLQYRDFEAGMPSYLFGRWQDRGWWYWYFCALAVKVPLGTWGLLSLAVVLRAKKLFCKMFGGNGPAAGSCCGARSGAAAFGSLDELAVLAPAAALLALVCWQSGFTRYLRYLLPAFPYAFIWTSGALTDLTRSRGSWGTRSVAFFLAWSISSSIWYSPHWISYFNEFTGGPAGGPSWVIDAQVDWGQDLLYLKDHIATTTHAEALRFAYFGAIDPRIAGIRFQLPPRATTVMADRSLIAPVPHDLVPGLYAVSVNCLYGYPCLVDDGQGGEAFLDRAYYSYFRRFKPDSTAGYSIYIYNLSADDIATEFAAGKTTPAAPPSCAAAAD